MQALTDNTQLSSDAESVLRQQLGSGQFQWPQQSHQFDAQEQAQLNMQLQLQQQQAQGMAPPPTPAQQLNVQTQFATPNPISTQSPTPEVATPRSATAARGTRRGKGGAASGTRSSRRRKNSVSPKEESDGSISEEFTMEGIKTKSGRKVHRPAHFNPAQKTPSRRRGPYRRNYDARICKVCQRGHSPQSNMIVFCDGCNTPYHQLCHDPPIDDIVIAIESAEWFCTNCAKLRELRPLTMGASGVDLTEEEKQTYLASLPVSALIEIISAAEKLHPDLPIYDPQTRSIVEALKKPRDATVPSTADEPSDPQWEESIIRAITAIGPAQPKTIFEWISTNYPALDGRDVRNEAQPSLQAALRKNKLLREGHTYRINPAYIGRATPLEKETVPGVVAPGSGIKLSPETVEGEDKMLVDDDLIAFSHRFREAIGGAGVNEVATVSAAA